MSSPPKISPLVLAASFLILPFLANAAAPFLGAAETQTASDFRLSSLRASLSNFSLKNLDERVYARLQGQGGEITQTAGHLPTQCSDGHDNDNNGAADFPDDYPNCASIDDLIEAVPQCNDRNDTDGDGGYDYADFTVGDCNESCDYYPRDTNCLSPAQESEEASQCNDGVDNDGDGLTDYSADLGCTSSSDDDETDPGGVWVLPSLSRSCPPRVDCLQEAPQGAFYPSVDLYFDNNPSINATNVNGNAYGTNASVYWNVQDSCSAECTSAPNSWWNGTLTGSSEGGSGSGHVDNLSISSPGAVTYTLTCHKLPCNSTDNSPKTDSVTATPQWDSRIVLFSGPTGVTANQDVYLTCSATDIRECTRSWNPGTPLVLSGANPQNCSSSAGFISAPTTFTLTCTGFDGATNHTASWPVGFISGPTPYFFINSINLIIIGPGSGGRSNKATVGVTPGGGFTGTIDLSAARPPALISANATLHIEPSTVTCNGTSCATAEFWVETPSDIPEDTYAITLTADPVPAGFDSKTADIPLRVRRFVPAFEEI